MMHIEKTLLIIGKSSPFGGIGFPLSLSIYYIVDLWLGVAVFPLCVCLLFCCFLGVFFISFCG